MILRVRMWCYGACWRSRSGKKQKRHHGNVEVSVAGVPNEAAARKAVRGFIDFCVCPSRTHAACSDITLLCDEPGDADGELRMRVVRGKRDALLGNPVGPVRVE